MEAKKEKIKLSEIVWLFVIGCLVGFVLETIWHFLKNGEWINKQGLLYGPFKPIYGFGLIFIVLAMHNYHDKKFWQKFIIGVILGSAFEYFGSLFQEYVFGTSTWNYSHFNLNIAGKKLISKINQKWYKIATIVVAIFMIINVSLTALASIRYSDRANNEQSANAVFKVIDELYPDDYMQLKFPKMKVIKK